jgi:uncharacterized protein (DUF58 family)
MFGASGKKLKGLGPIRQRRGTEFSLNGLMFIALTMFLALAAVNSQANLLFGVFGLMIGVMLISVAISRLVLVRLRIARNLPEHGVVGRPLTLTYEITNQKRYWPSLSVTLAELDGLEAFTRQPVAYMLHVAARATAHVPAELIPKRRGVHAFGAYQIGTSFPFGFVRRAVVRRQTDTLLIYPAIARVDPKLLLRFAGAEKTGAMLRPRRGGNDEFYGVKEFRTGENRRFIHWKRSARTGVLVSKEMTLVSPPRLMLFVDTHQRSRNGTESSSVERTIAMAGSLAVHALEAGLMVGLSAWSDDWMHLAPNRGKRHGRDLMAALARLPMNLTHDAGRLLDQGSGQLKSGTTAVLLTPRDLDAGSAYARGGMVVLSPLNALGRGAFKFDAGIDFEEGRNSDQATMRRSDKGKQTMTSPPSIRR